MPNLEDVWAAHKLRNEIAHGMNLILKRDTAERALEAYETALKNLGFLAKENKVSGIRCGRKIPVFERGFLSADAIELEAPEWSSLPS